MILRDRIDRAIDKDRHLVSIRDQQFYDAGIFRSRHLVVYREKRIKNE